MTIYRLSEKPILESSSTLVYGHSGSGKTTFIGTAGSRTLFINNGKGIDTIRSPFFISKYGVVDPLVVNITEGDNLKDGAKAFNEMADAISAALLTMSSEFDVIAIDDSTAMNSHADNRAIEIAATQRNSQTLTKAKATGVVVLDPGDYNFQMALVKQFLEWVRDECRRTRKHLIVGAHIRESFNKPAKQGDSPTLRRVAPGFSGLTFPDAIVALFDNVWKFEVVASGRETIYRAITKGNEMVMANTSMGGILDEQEKNPHFQNLLGKLQAAKANSTIKR